MGGTRRRRNKHLLLQFNLLEKVQSTRSLDKRGDDKRVEGRGLPLSPGHIKGTEGRESRDESSESRPFPKHVMRSRMGVKDHLVVLFARDVRVFREVEADPGRRRLVGRVVCGKTSGEGAGRRKR